MATAVVSEPPRPSVVISPCPVIPWNPATTTTLPSSNASIILSGSNSKIRPLLKASLVLMPACAPVKEIAFCPASWKAIAIKAMDTCSPVVKSMSISRPYVLEVICFANATKSSVVSPIADTTITILSPGCLPFKTRCTIARILSGVATELPPNFFTINANLNPSLLVYYHIPMVHLTIY